MIVEIVTAALILTSSRHGEDTVPPTKYVGHYYQVSPQEDLRRCIVWRESSNNLEAISPGGHGGLYQLTPELWVGAVWMMRAAPGERITKAERLKLQAIPVWEASRYWQDRAFYTVLNYEGPRSGLRHWAGGRWSCR
jgi:hypothetical protein